MTQTHNSDVLIVGAGISGISAAHHLMQHCPQKSFTILEARADIGGTWDLFKYPGIRSDSDMYTLGFSFRPWRSDKAIADAPSIMRYLRATIADSGLDKQIRYNKKVTAARWSSETNQWQLDVEDTATGAQETYNTQFLHLCTGYYNYDQGYKPHFPNEEAFQGEIVHPQFWREDLDYQGKKVVVIGSGATAVTLIPSMAEQTAHITMLQRSPTYIIAAPSENRFANKLRKYLPPKMAYGVARWFNILFQRFMFWYCKRFPARAKTLLLKAARAQLPEDFDIEKHLTPTYAPWDQRLCLAPDGDFFTALREGKADIVTDHIESFTETGIKLASGDVLDADIIVTATGLDLAFFGKVKMHVDGQQIHAGDTISYRGMMFSGVPNLALSTGYTNASWTLKCDLTSAYVCRLLNHMDKKGYRKAVAVADDVSAAPLLNLSSGYITRKADELPKQGAHLPWRLHQNYLLDLLALRFGRIDDGVIQFSNAPAVREDVPLAAE